MYERCRHYFLFVFGRWHHYLAGACYLRYVAKRGCYPTATSYL